MDTKTKETLLSALFIIILIGTMVGLYFFSGIITPQFGLGILVGLYYIYIVPVLNKRYMRFYGSECGIVSAYVPLINEVAIMKPWIAGTVILTTVLSLLSFGLVMLDPTVVGNIFGDIFALRYSKILGTVGLYSFLISEVLKGIGYFFVLKDISYSCDVAFSNRKVQFKGLAKFISAIFKYIPFLQYVFLVFPILRTASLLIASDNLEGLLLNNKFFDTLDVEEELEEEI